MHDCIGYHAFGGAQTHRFTVFLLLFLLLWNTHGLRFDRLSTEFGIKLNVQRIFLSTFPQTRGESDANTHTHMCNALRKERDRISQQKRNIHCSEMHEMLLRIRFVHSHSVFLLFAWVAVSVSLYSVDSYCARIETSHRRRLPIQKRNKCEAACISIAV